MSSPKLVEDPVDLMDRSLWSLRRSLVTRGWAPAESGKHASIEQKLFNKKSDHHAYFAILLERSPVGLGNVFIFRCHNRPHDGLVLHIDVYLILLLYYVVRTTTYYITLR